ncbi:transporter, partial [Rhizobium johnstonii]|uniref:transporter n=1 Tax=Rhizobium johnstonii TaxID=3019933 RepID=UPI003F9BD7CF
MGAPVVEGYVRYLAALVFTVGDPVLGALLGWESGNFHWQTGLLVNVPIGDYQ